MSAETRRCPAGHDWDVECPRCLWGEINRLRARLEAVKALAEELRERASHRGTLANGMLEADAIEECARELAAALRGDTDAE